MKDHEHFQQMAGKKVSQDLRVAPELTISCDRDVFLVNGKLVIMIMSTEMANQNIVACQAKDDTNTLVKTAMDLVPQLLLLHKTLIYWFCSVIIRQSNCFNLYLQFDRGCL